MNKCDRWIEKFCSDEPCPPAVEPRSALEPLPGQPIRDGFCKPLIAINSTSWAASRLAPEFLHNLGLRAPLEQLLQLLLVSRQQPTHLPKDERSKHPGDPMRLEFEGDRYARPLAIVGRDREIGLLLATAADEAQWRPIADEDGHYQFTVAI
jgi:hypothetical protein